MPNIINRLVRFPLTGHLHAGARYFIFMMMITSIVTGEEPKPLQGTTTTTEAPFRMQLNHPLVGVLGKPFPVVFYLYSSHSEDFTCEGEIVDTNGQLKLTGKWDLVLEEVLNEKVITSRSLKIADDSNALLPTLTGGPYKSEKSKSTWDAQAVFTRIGNYRFRLRYGEHSVEGDQFHIDKTLDPPPWIAVAVTPDKRLAVIGEPVIVTVQVKNNGSDSYPAIFGGDYRGASRALRFYCTAERADGTKGSDPEPLQDCMGGVGKAGPLLPGNTRERKLALGAYVRCPGPGSYRITVYHALGFGTPVPGIDADGMAGFGSYAKAGEFTLDLAVPTAQDAERIVRAGVNAKEEYERYQLLGHLHEPYFLEALQEALVQPNLTKYGPVLIDGIDSIRTTAATTVLINALNDRAPATRARAMERLRFRMPQPDWFLHSNQSAEQMARQRLQESLVIQTWDEGQAKQLQQKLQALVTSTDVDVLQGAIDLLGVVGDTEAAEKIACLADRLGVTPDSLTKNAITMNHLENAAYALGLRKMALCVVSVDSTPGRRICWARMLNGSQPPPTSEVDALLLGMLAHQSKDVRLAGLRGFSKDAGARLALPWKALFLDDDRTIFHSACHLSEQAPNATIALIVHECLQLDPAPDRKAFFKMMLQHIEPAK